MIPALTFVIPVRHQENCNDWAALKDRLTQTVKSIGRQTSDNWRAVIVANRGADLPDLPARFTVERVEFPPNPLYDIARFGREQVYDAFRLDKGRRVLKGMLSLESDYFMIVDDDDFVNSGIAGFVSENRSANGWKIDRGYVWSEGARIVLQHNDFARYCGTSLIIRSDLYQLPSSFADADIQYIKSMLGSHISIGDTLASRGTPLAPLPFRGAVYRIGHMGAHSRSSGLLSTAFLNTQYLLKPHHLLRNFLRLRMINGSMRRTFFGEE